MGLQGLVQKLLGPDALARFPPKLGHSPMSQIRLFIHYTSKREKPKGRRSATRSDSRTCVPAATGAITTTETRPHQLFLSRRCKQKFPQLARGTPAENLSVPKFFEQKPKSNIPPSHPNTLLPQKNH